MHKLNQVFFVAVVTMILSQTARRGRCIAWVATAARRNRNRVVLPQRQPQVQSVSASYASQSTSTTTRNRQDEEEILYKELQWLSSEIKRHDALYYSIGQEPELNDAAYDALAQRETELCERYPQLLERLQSESGLGVQATRFGGRVGSLDDVVAVSQPEQQRFVKRKHLTKMLSLDNVHDTKQLLQWLGRIRKKALYESTVSILTEPKLDGLSCSLRYERNPKTGQGSLQWAGTRGDGTSGQDVTAAMRRLEALPLSLELSDLAADKLEVRGEVVLPNTAFAALQVDYNLTFSNARNAASGILLRKDDDADSQALRSRLIFVAYDIVSSDDDDDDLDSISIRNRLQSWGFNVPQPVAETTLSVDPDQPWNETHVSNLLEYYEALEKHRTGEHSSLSFGDYDMDGCVHKVVSSSLRDILGTSNRAPRWAIAHKFPALTAITSLLAIEIQVGRTGVLTPVAHLEKVDLNGVSVQRATLHNFEHMRKTLGGCESIARGTKVFVRRAGDVIPQVVGTAQGGKVEADSSNDMILLTPPEKCPACGSSAVFDPSSTRNVSSSIDGESATTGRAIRCSGPPLLCQPRAVQALQHAYSRDALDIQGLSESRITQLMNESLLSMPSDVFFLTSDEQKLGEITELPGWGKKSVQSLVTAANRVVSNGIDLSRFIYSLGIRGIGRHSSVLIADIYGGVDDLLWDMQNASTVGEVDGELTFARLRDDGDSTKGIGPTTLLALEEFAREPILLEGAKKLADYVHIRSAEPKHSSAASAIGPFQGLSVVFTGALPGITRAEAQRLAKSMGATSTPSVITKSTDLVITGAKEGSKKVRDANALNIRVMRMGEFMKLGTEYR